MGETWFCYNEPESKSHREETHWFYDKESIQGGEVSKEGHGDKLLGQERTYDYWFPWKEWNCKECFLLANH